MNKIIFYQIALFIAIAYQIYMLIPNPTVSELFKVYPFEVIFFLAFDFLITVLLAFALFRTTKYYKVKK